MTDTAALIVKNAARWKQAKLTRSDFGPTARKLCLAKSRYQAVSAKTGVPWFIIAVIHEREASQNWNTQLGQGDPLDRVSTHIPTGRGPFKSWEDGAYDALENCGPYASRWHDWSAGGSLTLLEMYNGLGYANKGLPSPYVWAGTDQYTTGKYVADGVFDPNAVDRQLGCAGLLMAMQQTDSSIIFTGKTVTVPAKHVAAGGAIAGGVVVAQQAHAAGASPAVIAAIVIGAVVVAIIAWLILHNKT